MTTSNPPRGLKRFNTCLHYENVAQAADWLQRVFGFTLGEVAIKADGTYDFAEMLFEGEIIILTQYPDDTDPTQVTASKTRSHHQLVYVDDVHAFHEHVRSHDVEVMSGPQKMYWGDVLFRVVDCGGHIWSFSQHVEDIAEADLRPPP